MRREIVAAQLEKLFAYMISHVFDHSQSNGSREILLREVEDTAKYGEPNNQEDERVEHLLFLSAEDIIKDSAKKQGNDPVGGPIEDHGAKRNGKTCTMGLEIA